MNKEQVRNDGFTFNPQGGENEHIIQPHPSNIKLVQEPMTDSGQMEATRNAKQHEAIKWFRTNNPELKKLVTIYNGKPQDTRDSESASVKSLAKMFGDSLDWAYRCYSIAPEKLHEVKTPGEKPFFQPYIYLFNVLIAFEWWPSMHNVAMVERAARRAADFLFDVTNGWMTFGQVIIAGPKMLDCADIQIMASNRLLPRSWVGGLHEPAKYMPIRLGRGLWQKNNPGTIPWDEPEGYRVLVHEWAHYALELLDDYVDSQHVYIRENPRIKLRPNEGRRSNQMLQLSSIEVPHASIMSTLVGTSELTAKKSANSAERKQTEWDVLINGFQGLDKKGDKKQTPRFPRLTEDALERQARNEESVQQIEGPMPLRELPHVRVLVPDNQHTPLEWSSELLLPVSALPAQIKPEHCWVYLLKQPDHQGIPQRIVAQGTFEAQPEEGFRLFGADHKDVIMLIGDDSTWKQRVFCGTIQSLKFAKENRHTIGTADWKDVTPDPFPFIDVVPEGVNQPADRTVPIRVFMSDADKALSGTVHVFPLDHVNAPGMRDPIPVDLGSPSPVVSLDGHIFVKLNQQNRETFFIATYAQGGGPPTGSPVGSTPITPGSSEGNLAIFFANEGHNTYLEQSPHHSKIRVITTRLPGGAPAMLPASESEARGYAYSVCSNEALPMNYFPTLSLAYDRRTELQDGEAIVHRWDDTQKTWHPIGSYRPNGAWYVAIPLNYRSAPNLINPDVEAGKRIERYRLYLVPYGD